MPRTVATDAGSRSGATLMAARRAAVGHDRLVTVSDPQLLLEACGLENADVLDLLRDIRSTLEAEVAPWGRTPAGVAIHTTSCTGVDQARRLAKKAGLPVVEAWR